MQTLDSASSSSPGVADGDQRHPAARRRTSGEDPTRILHTKESVSADFGGKLRVSSWRYYFAIDWKQLSTPWAETGSLTD
jgi:hypothetical protein